MAFVVPTEQAIWPGNAKWYINEDGELSPCSLKKLTLSFITENLGSVCNVECEDPRTIYCAAPIASASSRESIQRYREATGGGAGKSACDRDLKVFARTSSHNSLTESSVVNVNGNGIKVNSTSGTGANFTSRNGTQDQRFIPYTMFNIPNYGRVYDKSNSTDPPSENAERLDLFKRDFFHFQWRQPDVYLSPRTVAMFLEELDRCGLLNDSTLSLFDTPRMQLNEVRIHRCGSLISARGLNFLIHNKLYRLELHGLQIPIKFVINSLNSWTKANLSVLSLVSYAPSDRQSAYKQLHRLQSLQELDLSNNNCLDPASLKMLLLRLPNLHRLSISHCVNVNTIEPLMVVCDQLQHLSLSGVMIHDTAITISVLKTLTRLRFLDVSTVATNHDVRHEECINEVLMSPHFAPDLEFIDVSNQLEVSEQVLLSFLSTHPNVKGVALVNVPLCADFCTSKWPQVKFLSDVGSSEGDVCVLDRLTECMQHYRRRHVLAQQMLTLVSAAPASSPSKPQPKLVASILQCMEDFQSREYIQTLSSACLHNLTVGSLGAALHPNLLRSVVHATIHAMTLHGDNHQLQKNGLLLLCCDSVLHNVSFNQYWVAMKALHALHSYADDRVDLMAVGICSILAAKLTNEQTAQLGSNPAFMNKLLVLVRGRVQENNADIMLQFTLSALWNLTDESPVTCEIFLNQDGLQLFINLLLTFPDETSVETKVLGLFNNVAEVPELRKELLKPPFIAMLRRQLQSEHIAVSYFAAGISAHLVCAEQAAWLAADDLPYNEVLAELGDAVLGWECPIEEMVAYKSFQPFLPLLHASGAPYVQLWALWALHHVTSNNSDYYCPMLIREGIPELLLTLRDDAPSSAPFLRDFALKLLALVAAYEIRDAKNQTGKTAPTFIPRSRS